MKTKNAKSGKTTISRAKNGRFQKGNKPWNKGTTKPSMNREKKSQNKGKNGADESYVHIRLERRNIEPATPNFVYESKDLAERVCTRFLWSVITKKPQQIKIENQTYYSSAIVEKLVNANKKELTKHEEEVSALEDKYAALKDEYEHIVSSGEELCDAAQAISNEALRLRKQKRFWKGLAIASLSYVALSLLLALSICNRARAPQTPPAIVEIAN